MSIKKHIKRASDRAGTQTRKAYLEFVKKYPYAKKLDEFNEFCGSYGMLGGSSAKVVHSMARTEWMNIVLYLSPADRAMLSFIVEYPHLVRKLQASLKKAAAADKRWSGFASGTQQQLARLIRQIQSARKGPVRKDYKKIDISNNLRFLSMCPNASLNCRAVCLNTSGRGGWPASSAKTKELQKQFSKTDLQDGITISDDLEYLYLRGYKVFYGGETNSVQQARTKRTHFIWMMWAEYGVLKNPINDILYNESLEFIKEAREVKRSIAIRFNGTSDFPVETLKRTDGSYLVDSLGKKKVVCYDYTKHYGRMLKWIQARTWKGIPKNGDVTRKGGFPSNYYLSFSWSEVNSNQALDVLKRGANVVMVFKRSAHQTGTGLPKKAGTKGILPTSIAIPQLTNQKWRVDPDWTATVIDGDVTDLRFADPTPFTKNGGNVVALIAKGKAAKPYTEKARKAIFQRFTLPATIAEDRSLIIRENPITSKQRAVVGTDIDIINSAVSKIQGYTITTTAMGT